jgi:anti-sigma B factor antagonist
MAAAAEGGGYVGEERLRIDRTADPRSLKLVGELDLATVEDAADALSGDVVEDGDLTLDLSELTFVDSSGVHLLVQVARTLSGRGRLILAFPRDPVDRILDLNGVDKLAELVIIDDPD